jgi:hypothetical protein
MIQGQQMKSVPELNQTGLKLRSTGMRAILALLALGASLMATSALAVVHPFPSAFKTQIISRRHRGFPSMSRQR